MPFHSKINLASLHSLTSHINTVWKGFCSSTKTNYVHIFIGIALDISITSVKIPILMILSFTSFLCKGLPQLPVHTCLSISVISFHCCIAHCHTHSDLDLDQNSGRGRPEPVLRDFLTRQKSRSQWAGFFPWHSSRLLSTHIPVVIELRSLQLAVRQTPPSAPRGHPHVLPCGPHIQSQQQGVSPVLNSSHSESLPSASDLPPWLTRSWDELRPTSCS